MLKKMIILTFGLALGLLNFACSPVSSNNNPTSSFDNYTTGKTITIKPSDKNKTPKRVEYVNSGDKDVFNQIKDSSLSNNAASTNEVATHLAFRQSIQTANLYFYKDNQLTNEIDGSIALLIIKTNNNNDITYHQFIAESDQLNNISGTASKKKNNHPFTQKNKYRSNITASIDCLDQDYCERSVISLSIGKDIKIKNGTRDFEITAKVGITRRKAKVIVKKDENSENHQAPGHFETLLNDSNQNNETNAEKVDVVVTDGISYSQISVNDQINMHIPVTDPRETDALLTADHVIVKDTEVSEVIFQGVSPETGSIIIDVTTVEKNQTDSHESEYQPIISNTTKNRVLIITETDRSLIEDGQITDNFNINHIKEKIENNEATWGDVGVNPNTSLFFKDIQNEELLKKVLKQEAELESLRHHPRVIKIITAKNGEVKNKVCNSYIKNMAPARKIISSAMAANDVSPNFASIMYNESGYGKNSYPIQVNEMKKNCETSAGPIQLNFATTTDLLDGTHSKGSLVERLTNNGYEWIHTPSKLHMKTYFVKNKHKMSFIKGKDCSIPNPEVYKNDHRMFIEPASVLLGAQMRYIYYKKDHEASRAYASFNRGPYNYYKETRFNNLSLAQIDHFNMSAEGISAGKEKYHREGIAYGFKAAAIRSILTQPETYCSDQGMDEDTIIDIYKNADEKVKLIEVQKEMKLFYPNRPPILDYSKSIYKVPFS